MPPPLLVVLFVELLGLLVEVGLMVELVEVLGLVVEVTFTGFMWRRTLRPPICQ